MNLLVAKAFGATSIVVTDMLAANLQLASRLGATSTLKVDPAAPPDQAAANLKAAFGGAEGPDIVIDCAGFESTMQVLLLQALKFEAMILGTAVSAGGESPIDAARGCCNVDE